MDGQGEENQEEEFVNGRGPELKIVFMAFSHVPQTPLMLMPHGERAGPDSGQ